MQVEVLFFAAARERARMGETQIEVPEGASIRVVLEALETRFSELAPLRPYLRIAVNEAFATDLDQVVHARDTLALIPPISGGNLAVALQHEPLVQSQIEALVHRPESGAVVSFVGTVRDHTGDHGVIRLEYEAYEPMALKVLADIVSRGQAQHPTTRIAVHHRLGVLGVGEAAVVVAVSSPHRAAAFDACRFVIEALKEDVPIFKKEVREDGSIWVGLGP